MKRDIYEVNDVLHDTKVGFDLEFVARLMKVLELAEENMTAYNGRTDQSDLVMEYANTLAHEIVEHITPDELMELEDEGMIDVW